MSAKDPEVYKPVGISLALGLYFALGLAFIIAFSIFRAFFPLTYSPRLRLKRVAPPKLPRGCLSWLVPIFYVTEAELISNVGLDGAMLLRFLKMCCQLFAVLSVIGAFVLIPLNVTASGDLPAKISEEQWLTLMSIENVPNQSYSILSTHIVFTWIFTFIVYYHVIRFYRSFIALRLQQQEYVLRRSKLSKIEMRSVMVFGIPSELRHEVDLASFYEGLGIGTVENVVICRRWVKLREAVAMRAYYLKQLECLYAAVKSRRGQWWRNLKSQLLASHLDNDSASVSSVASPRRLAPLDKNEACIFEIKAQLDAVPKHLRPRHRTGFMGLVGSSVDSADYYGAKFIEWDLEVARLRRVPEHSTPTAVAFVTFDSPVSATLASQILLGKRPLACMTRPAPEPRDVFWPNLSSSSANPLIKFMRGLGVQMSLIVLVFFTATPIAFLAGWTTPAGLAKLFPQLKDLFESMTPFIRSLLTGALPALVTSLWLATLPSLLFYLSQAQGLEALSWLEQSVLSKYYWYLITNIVIVFAIARSVWNAISIFDVIQQPTLLLNILADSMPRMASFYVNYIIVQAFAIFPAQLLLVGPLFLTFVSRLAPWTRNSPRDVSDAYYPSVLTSINYGIAFPMPLLILAVGLTYSQILPIVLPFCALCFGIAWVVYKYQLLYVHIPKFETLGGFVPLVVNRTMLGLVIYQIVMLAVLALKMVPRDGAEVEKFDFVFIRAATWGPYAYTLLSMIPLLIITFFVYWWMKQGYFKQTRNVPMEILGQIVQELGPDTHVGRREAMQTQTSPSIAPEELTHVAERSESSMGKELKEVSPNDLITHNEYLSNPWLTPKQLSAGYLHGASSSVAVEDVAATEKVSKTIRQRQRPRRTSRAAAIAGVRRTRARSSSDEQQPLLSSDGMSDSDDEKDTARPQNGRRDNDPVSAYHPPSWIDRSRQDSVTSQTTSEHDASHLHITIAENGSTATAADDSFHIEPPMSHVTGVLDTPLDAAHWPFLASGDEQDLILANGGSTPTASTNNSSNNNNINPSSIPTPSISPRNYDDLQLHTYLHPALIGRLPLPWLPGPQSRVFTEARAEQERWQREVWRRVSQQLRIGVRLDLARAAAAGGSQGDHGDDEALRIRGGRREGSASVTTRVKSFVDGATSWLYLAITD
ncbi:hypothetical protein SmJEL517_g00833 [Synchytrium microbalum]|uniref:CSC1/OSCA1-like 7TM region domain-containing protein n=1 Tax=Synchytrium microbalum TaxID=1806994 RepID=A0A507CCI4_9FUNG|nr:uncharacterized protein SmJEL517_g00833 [Synchytrium microbalum]TPX37211.1 hypothetical protein SmJEL517_g00833 [Synchytrium microbalum]